MLFNIYMEELTKKGYDFNWIIKYLDITDNDLIKKFKILNSIVNKKNKDDAPIDNTNQPLKLYDGIRYHGNSIGRYKPLNNVIEIKEEINLEYDDEFSSQHILIAHEFAHALRGTEPILGSRGGHGVNFFLRMFRDIVWNSNAISIPNKFLAIIKEFAYSCSLGIYKVVERTFRSNSSLVSLGLKYFTINQLLVDTRSDINNLGHWFIKIIKENYKGIDSNDILHMTIENIFKDIISNKEKVDKIISIGKLKSH